MSRSGDATLHWSEQGQARCALWRSEGGQPLPRRVVCADDTMPADTAYRLACEGMALLWRGDFHNACQLLQAMARRLDLRDWLDLIGKYFYESRVLTYPRRRGWANQAVINAFRLVDHIVVMTRGGPDNATALLLYYIYEIGFRFWDSAYAAALTMVLLAILGITALVQFFVLERRTHYQ